MGMTWASKAVSAGRSKPAATPMRKTTSEDADEAHVLGVEREPGEDDGAPTTRSDAREQDDRASVPPVGDVAADEHEAEGGDGLDEPEHAERQRVAGDLVGLEGHDRGDG